MSSFAFYFNKTLVWLRYKIYVKGLDEIEQMDDFRPILFVSNHPSLTDPMALISILWKKFKPRSLVRDLQVDRPIIGRLVRDFEPITVPDTRNGIKDKAHLLRESIKISVEEIKKGRNVLIWPAGRLSRDGYDYFEERSGLYTIVSSCPNIRIVAIRSQGIWGSRLSWWNGPDMAVWKAFAIGFICLIINGIFFMPKRKVTYDFTELTGFENLSRKEINQKIQTHLNAIEQPAVEVPLLWWQKTKITALAEPKPFKM